ncbi:MAG: universal stress protein [Nocardioidaceae bacterium]
MTTQADPAARARAAQRSPRIVVGVDGSEHNQAAVQWACAEAKELDAELVLTAACPLYPNAPGAWAVDLSIQEFEDSTRASLTEMRERLSTTVKTISTHVRTDGAVPTLLSMADDADLVVLGQRGVGATRRIMVGSTSIGVAGRSPVPVVVVPDSWTGPRVAAGPVVVGVFLTDDPQKQRDGEVLEFAFARAARLRAPLVAVAALEKPRHGGVADATDALPAFLQPWTRRYPDVDVEARVTSDSPTAAVLEAAPDARMVVLGRHTRARHFGGFALGSTARSVLRHAPCPVAVIPLATD